MSKIRMSCLILTLLLILSIGNWASAVKLSPNNEFGRTANSTENNAQTIVYVEPENVTANENETITIRVKVRNVTDLYGIEVQFCWNPSILKYVSHTVKAPVETYPDGILHSPVIIVKDQVDENASMPGAEPGTMYWLSCVSYLPADPFNGSGTVFEMTFQVVKEGACYLHIIYSQLADSAGNPITHKTRDGNFWSTPEPSFAPYANFTYSPERVFVNRTNVVFDASASYDPDGNITLYMWDFGDGTKINTTEPTIEHTYITAGNYMVNLTAIDNEGYKNWTTASLTVSEEYYSLEVIADVGELHFKGEIAEFYILVLRQGEPCNTSKINAILYHEGKEIKTFTTPDIKTIRTGLYRIEYHIPANATPGIYLIYVEAYLQIGDTQLKGATIKSFQISPTLSNNLNEIKATLIEIKDGIGTINSTIGILKINLTEIKATLIEIKDGIGIINSTIGFLKADLTEINATVTEVRGNLAKVQTTLGKVQDSLGTIQSIATYGIIAACIFSLIAAIVAILVLLLLKKKKQQT